MSSKIHIFEGLVLTRLFTADFLRTSIGSKIIGDGAAVLLLATIATASAFQEIWVQIPLMERFAFLPWILFIFTYYICSKYEKAQNIVKTTKTLKRKNYYYTLWWGIFFMLFHYYYIFLHLCPALQDFGVTRIIGDLHFTSASINSAIGSGLLAKLNPGLQIIGLATALYGVIRATSGRIYINGYWAINVMDYGEENRLITSGPYLNVRHPIYQGQNLLALGTAMISGSILFYIFFALVFFLNRARALVEEEEMEILFGEDYKQYKKETYFMINRMY